MLKRVSLKTHKRKCSQHNIRVSEAEQMDKAWLTFYVKYQYYNNY